MHYHTNKHVGNHGGAYTDLDGMSRQFTYIDHDKKSKTSFSSSTSFNKEWDKLEKICLNHPIFEEYLQINGLEWGVNVTLGDLRNIAKAIAVIKK